MNVYKKIISFVQQQLIASALDSTQVPFVEDTYAQQAPEELAQKVNEAAHVFGFRKVYEVIVPKRAGILVNPSNKMLSFGVNQQTRNALIIINPEWFNQRSAQEQTFLLGRAFRLLEKGMFPVHYQQFVLALLVAGLCTAGAVGYAANQICQSFGYTSTVLVACVAGGVAYMVLRLLGPVRNKIAQYYIDRYYFSIHREVIARTGNKEAAVQALQAQDHFVQQELAQGEQYWKPFEYVFSQQAKDLQ